MNDDKVLRQAAAIRHIIDEDPGEGERALARLAATDALPAKHRNALLSLVVTRPTVDTPDLMPEWRARVRAVLDEVIRLRPDDVSHGAHRDAKVRLFRALRRSVPEQEVVCSAEGLTTSFGRNRFALGPVSFELRSGEITALVGDNAHGKTTLLRTLAGELPPTSGDLRYPALWDQKRLNWPVLKAQISYLPQELPRWRGSLEDALHWEAALSGLSPSENDSEVKFYIQRLDLAQDLSKRWSALSGGMKLRFWLARALVGRPRLLLLDEPLAALATTRQAGFLWDIEQLARSHRRPAAVMISSHVLDPLEAVADNLLFLRDGKLLYEGPLADVGATRDVNIYECQSTMNLETLKGRIGARVQEVTDDGVYYQITTGVDMSSEEMLQILIDAGVPFTHFRDSSQRIKTLFLRR